MSEVRIGMRLLSTVSGADDGVITVTEITDRGFKYDLGPDARLDLIPRLGLSMIRQGHEHFGYNGEALYEVADA